MDFYIDKPIAEIDSSLLCKLDQASRIVVKAGIKVIHQGEIDATTAAIRIAEVLNKDIIYESRVNGQRPS